MDVYKVRIEDTESKIIDKEGFEAETFRRDPWYQPGSAGKLAQFAVCPACDNPVQLVGLYELPPNVKNPFGKHATKSIRGIAPFDSEARNDCPYFQPRQHKKTGNRLANSPLSTQTSSDKNGWKTKPCPQVYPLNKPVSDVGHAEPASGSQSTMASLYTSAPHTP